MQPDLPFASPTKSRILDAVLLHAEQEAEYRINNAASRKNDPRALELRATHYEGIVAGYRRVKGLSSSEKQTLRFVRHELRQIRARQRPNLLTKLLYVRPINWFFNSLLGRQGNYRTHNRALKSYEKSTILDVNAANLQESMKASGFTNHMERQLKERLAHNMPEFSFRYYDLKRPDTDFVLHFKKLPGTEAYYFEKFDATYRPTWQALVRNERSPDIMSFSTTDKIVFNADQARHLAAGRPVQREIAGETVWITPDKASTAGLKAKTFDLDKAIDAWPIKEAQSEASRRDLIRDLSQGKQREVTLYLADGTEQLLRITVAVDVQALNFRSTDGQLVDARRMVEEGSLVQNAARKIQGRIIDLSTLRTAQTRAFAR